MILLEDMINVLLENGYCERDIAHMYGEEIIEAYVQVTNGGYDTYAY